MVIRYFELGFVAATSYLSFSDVLFVTLCLLTIRGLCGCLAVCCCFVLCFLADIFIMLRVDLLLVIDVTTLGFLWFAIGGRYWFVLLLC